ncbi:efflux RND transporter permease subunit [Marinobacter persicus]|uniref:AcrB/AcrD/AcrF family protein n=1 Tax=Marinobacter persicus TaxID=930118 RepID=A0A2S6G5T4_9GAMM|nr:efflux RND transporter permease subunit [Marinobacter persicus]KXS54020.1 MAG: acriflavin resistance protein [Marinobacter sp. T13-3]PPK51215.1 AcrB/AcrD/AcrF family protein [Marinobacter persicus]PPK54484.1 AcrB/AcrD/AcrF family protein [Marinobacter persicus]PPK57810.1 AcrB/AcrD/AcrF family protein [Marinobacter persicus]
MAPGSLQTWLFAEGTARAIEREFLSFESAGRIAYVDAELKEGDSIRQGQTIAYQQQDRPQAELASARAGVVEAQCGATRLRPILTTSITTVAGLLPLAIGSPMYAPLCYAIIFGLVASTLLSLMIVPCLYLLLTRESQRSASVLD